MSATETWPQYRKNVQYSDKSKLNTLDVCVPQPPDNDPEKLWVIFIHGGAWLDPEIDASSFKKTQDTMLQSSEINHMAGFASINYRLSPNPSHPRYPSEPTDPARNARHPDHINDVLAALAYLQNHYAIGHRYVLIGHSCGATLAFQVVMKRQWQSQCNPLADSTRDVKLPLAILAVEGLYDLPALVKYHSSEPVYRDFVTNAFGSDESVWKTISPTQSDYGVTWPEGRLVVIAHSHEDELVEWEQADLMEKALRFRGWDEEKEDRRLRVIELRGKHDEAWQTSTELARAIVFTLQRVRDGR